MVVVGSVGEGRKIPYICPKLLSSQPVVVCLTFYLFCLFTLWCVCKKKKKNGMVPWSFYTMSKTTTTYTHTKEMPTIPKDVCPNTMQQRVGKNGRDSEQVVAVAVEVGESVEGGGYSRYRQVSSKRAGSEERRGEKRGEGG